MPKDRYHEEQWGSLTIPKDDGRYAAWKKLVESHLCEFLPEVSERSSVLYEAMEYSLSAGGKRLRPVLLLEACSVCSGDVPHALPYACAIEFIHTYSLIHDDHPSMDDDDYRRGKLTNHKVFGDDIAILAGDGLLNSAFDIMLEAVLEAAAEGRSTQMLVRAAYEISKAAGVRGMVAGQTADVKNTDARRMAQAKDADDIASAMKDVGGDSEMLLYIHRNKTGALIRAAVRAGALIAGASEKQFEILTEYAENLGLAFQITDDILDVVGDEAALGKSTGADERLGKLTYPSVYGIEESRRRLKEVTQKAVSAAESLGEEGSFLGKLAIDLQDRIT